MAEREEQTMASTTQNKMESFANRVARPLVDSAHDIWLAGLGAFAMTRKESEKLLEQGTDLFERLVAEGETFEQRARQTVRTETEQVTARLRKNLGLTKQPVPYHLLPDGEGWTVRRELSDENLSRHDTKDAALNAARDIAHAHMPSRLVVHRADGTIQTSYTYE
jgi:hypothetical protein